jgi:AAA domain
MTNRGPADGHEKHIPPEPTLTPTAYGYRAAWDNSAVVFEVHRPHYDAGDRLRAELVARLEDTIVNQADICLVNQRDRVDFHSVAAARDGRVDWQNYLLSLVSPLQGALRQRGEAEAETPGDIPTPWTHIKPAPVFLAEEDPPFEGLAKDLLALGAMTMMSAPKGLGKTQVALALGVALATGGIFRGERVKPVRVLLLDRDNPEPTLKQRLRNWGATVANNLHVLTRQHAPDLKNREAWAQFPLESYDVLMIDAVGSFTEGITEKEGRLTTEVLATLLDLARRGIAILLLMNVTKDGVAFRGRGEWTERVDIAYEVRDATGFTPSGKREWWRELPPAGEAEWADRAARRTGKVTFRLAFVPNKFRLGMEPDPFCLELHLPAGAPWTLADVTDQLITAGEAAVQAATQAEQAQQAHTVQALADLVAERHRQGAPLSKNDAETFLREHDIGRNEARTLIEMYAGVKWHISDERRGVLHTLLPLISGEVARFSQPAIDAASQPSEPRQPGPQGDEVMASENPPQGRPSETSPPRQQISDHTCATHGEGGMVPENGRRICGICLGMPMERIELLRQRGRLGGGPTEA